MNNAAPLLQVRQVAASRPGESGALQRVLQETTLKVEAGEILAVVGPSGSGKSTLLRLLNRLLEAESGDILLSGVNLRTLPPAELRACIPLVSQKPFLFPGTVMENLQAPARLRRSELPDFSDPSLHELLELCHVDPAWLDRDARKLSVGQQQRVCLARAMVGPCQVLLLDEPTSALDRPTADQMALTFRQLAREKNLAIIFVTHDLRLTERCADHVIFMADGVVVEEGPTSRILNHPQTAEVRAFLASGSEDDREVSV
jgi:putative ABC transport system ATP-binding protein